MVLHHVKTTIIKRFTVNTYTDFTNCIFRFCFTVNENDKK